ncbi:MAG: hypothetical protein AAFR79_10240 [Pseudomonadota bacterium]
MRRYQLAVCAVVGAVAMAGGAAAEDRSARAVFDALAESGENQAVAVAYLSGAAEALVVADRALRVDRPDARLFCPETGASLSSAALPSMLEEAGAWDLPLPEALLAALARRYPCPR